MGTRFLNSFVISIVVACGAWFGHSAVAFAQALTPAEISKRLAAESMASLQKGEETNGPEARRTAFLEGVELARRAIEADELNPDAHFAMFANKGRIMELDGITANPMTLLSATRELNRTLEIDPNHADALAAKGGMYRQLPWVLGGSKEKARDYLIRSVENDYEHACGARIELAELYRDLGEPERGIPLLRKAVEVAKRDDKPGKLERAEELLRELGHP